MQRLTSTLAFSLLVAALPAQTIGIDDLDPTTGTSNAFPFNTTTGGNTSLHVYSAAALQARGVCTGATLLDIAVAPSTGSAGIYNAPNALLQIGHLLVSPPVPGNWGTHLDQPITVHDPLMGPYTFPWTVNTYTSLPGTQTTGFVWDGVRDIGILYSSSPGVTGSFSARRSATQLRHYVTTYNATNQTPTSNGLFAMEVQLTWAPGANCATKTTYGNGCYNGAASFYQLFTGLPVFDLAGGPGTEIVVNNIATASGFLVTNGTSAWFPPAGSQVLNNAATPAAMGDDSFSQPLNLPFTFPFAGGTTNVIHAAANGYIVLGSTTSNASDFTPSVLELLSQQSRLAPLWCDLQPAINLTTNPAAGVYFDVDPSNQAVYVTWLDCADRNGSVPAAGATSVNVQCVLRANGDVEYRFGTITPNATSIGGVLVGWSPGTAVAGGAIDPGNVDLSTAIPFATTGPDRRSLALDSNLPKLGTTFTLTTSNVPAVAPLAFLFFGDAQLPGIDLGFAGAAGCSAWTNANLASATSPVTGTTSTASIPIANNPLLIGTTLTTQAVAFSLDNTLNLITSNGLSWTVGN